MNKIDLNQASADELDGAVEGIGPERARYIVEDRERRGPFRTIDDIDRVDGIDDVLRVKIKQAAMVREERPSAPARPRATDRGRRERGRLDLNTATIDELDEMIEGIGPERARHIVEDRARRGPFRTVADIDRVDGIDDVLRAKIKAVATVGDEGARPSA